jgi:DNA end-binding protein Ku
MAATVWKGSISFGLVSFPVRLLSAARREGVHFHMLHSKDMSRVKEVWYCAEENKPIGRSEMIKGYETAKGKYVTVDDADLKKIAPTTASTMEILQVVKSSEVDPVYFDASYYVVPDAKAEKAYVLFIAALEETKQNAVAKLAMHNREYTVLIRPSRNGLMLHTLFYKDELHEASQAAGAEARYTAKELNLAKSLVSALAAPFKPAQFHDTYRENVEHLIEQKQKGQKVTSIKQPKKAPVVDLMKALQQSLKSVSGGHSTAASKTKTRRRAA